MPECLFPRVGSLPSGPLDAITDVGEVRVGHCTLDAGAIQTGVTAILPNADPLLRKPLAARLPRLQRLWQERGAHAGSRTGLP